MIILQHIRSIKQSQNLLAIYMKHVECIRIIVGDTKTGQVEFISPNQSKLSASQQSAVFAAKQLKNSIKHHIRAKRYLCFEENVHYLQTSIPNLSHEISFVNNDDDTTLFSMYKTIATDSSMPYNFYNVYQEFKRQNVLHHDSEDKMFIQQWRITDVNSDYSICSSYSKYFVVPHMLKDSQIPAAASMRAHQRLPILVWACPHTGVSLTRSSQPLYGINIMGRDKSLDDDIHVLNCIVSTNPNSNQLVILDLRPKIAAQANRIRGAGFEVDYENTEIHFMNIPNIHGVRSSAQKLQELILSSDIKQMNNWLSMLESTKWLEQILSLLQASWFAVEKMFCLRQSVLIHCSDSVDRTNKVASLIQLMIDPYFRSLKGFCSLIEKEWLCNGHWFSLRYGCGSYEPNSNQRSPIFLQFLEAVYQLISNQPNLFEFNSKFLLALHDALHSCEFTSFIYDSEKDRVENQKHHRSLLVYLLDPIRVEKYRNREYCPQRRIIKPDLRFSSIKLWNEYWFRFVL